jgi:hypothetical protein
MNGESKPGHFVTLGAGLVCCFLGIIILGALAGIIPTDEASFLAPPAILFTIGSGLLLLGIIIWIPENAPSWIRGGLGLALIGMLAVVCNWSAFASDVQYSSNLQLGPFSSGAEDSIGGRIVFGLAALAVDLLLLGSVIWIARAAIRKIRR